MKRILILGAALLPLLGGIALARGPGGGGGGNHGGGGGGDPRATGAVGPGAYADWQEQWRALRNQTAQGRNPGTPAMPGGATHG